MARRGTPRGTDGDGAGRPRRDPEVGRQQRGERLAALTAAGVVRAADGLPIAERWDDLLAAVRDHQVVIVAGETGSGKSTQLP